MGLALRGCRTARGRGAGPGSGEPGGATAADDAMASASAGRSHGGASSGSVPACAEASCDGSSRSVPGRRPRMRSVRDFGSPGSREAAWAPPWAEGSEEEDTPAATSSARITSPVWTARSTGSGRGWGTLRSRILTSGTGLRSAPRPAVLDGVEDSGSGANGEALARDPLAGTGLATGASASAAACRDSSRAFFSSDLARFSMAASSAASFSSGVLGIRTQR